MTKINKTTCNIYIHTHISNPSLNLRLRAKSKSEIYSMMFNRYIQLGHNYIFSVLKNMGASLSYGPS